MWKSGVDLWESLLLWLKGTTSAYDGNHMLYDSERYADGVPYSAILVSNEQDQLKFQMTLVQYAL